MLSNRCCNILLLLLKSNQSLKLKDIGAEFKISERATRYDLDAIDNFLLKFDFDILSRKTNVGVSYNIAGEDRKRLLSAILSEREGTIYDTPTSRLMSVLVNLILSKKHIFIDGEAERLMVSRSTVFKDFEKLRMLFNYEKDTLQSSVLGYILEGEEIKLCIECAKVVLSIIEARDIIEIITYASDGDSLLLGNKMYKLFDGVSEEGLKKSLLMIESTHLENVRDNTYAFCALAIAIAKRRGNIEKETIKGEYSQEIQNIAQPIFGDSSGGYAFMQSLLEYTRELETSGADKSSFPDIQLFAHNMAKKVSLLTEGVYPSSRLIGVVADELIDLIFDDLRGKDKSPLTIDMSGHENLYQTIKEELQILESIIKRQIVDADIARFYRVFVGAYKFDKVNRDKKTVIVLCPFDKTYSNLVAEKIREMFDVTVFESLGMKVLDRDIKQQSASLVVSTLPLGGSEVDFVKIGSNLEEDTLAKLKDFLPTREVGSGVLKSIYNILKNHDIDNDKIQNILLDISSELNIPMEKPRQEAESDGKISRVSFISANDYKSALESAGQLLIQTGAVEKEYIADMISEVENSKTHMVVMDGIVLAHSRNDANVKKVGGVLVRLSQKVPFVENGDEMCDIVFAISSSGVDSHFNLIAGISEVLSDASSLEKLRNSKSEEEILQLFQNIGNNK